MNGNCPDLTSRQEDILTCIVQGLFREAGAGRFALSGGELSTEYQFGDGAQRDGAVGRDGIHRGAAYFGGARANGCGISLLCTSAPADAQLDPRRTKSHLGAGRYAASRYGTMDAADGCTIGTFGADGVHRNAADLTGEFLQTCRADFDSGAAGADGVGFE